jgi:Ice-binding-like
MPRQFHAVSGDDPIRNRRRHHRLAAAAGLLVAALLILAPVAFSAQAPVGLGTTDSFAVLAGSTVTNTGPSVISGSVGLDPGSAVIGFPPGIVLAGTTHVSDGVALQAKNDLVTAYNDAAGRSSTATVSGDLAGRTLTPGVYTSASSLGLSGALTLDAQGNPSAVFVFQAGSSLIVGSGSQVNLIGGAQACNVYWQVGSSATVGTGSAFVGNILALTSITMTTGATLNGRALARNGAVTLDTNTITRSTCAADSTTGGGSGTSTGTGSTTGAGTTTGSTGATGTTGGTGTHRRRHHKPVKPVKPVKRAAPKPVKPATPTPVKPTAPKPPAFTG